MNTNTSEFLKKWGGIVVTLVLLIIAGIFIKYTKKPAPVTPSDSAALTTNLGSTTAPTTGVVSAKPEIAGAKITPVSANATYTNPSWSVKFTVRGDWTVNEIPDSTGKLHQMQLSGTKNVVFISKNEAIGFSDDLKYTTSTRTISGQTVSVRTYTRPDSQFASYQVFSLKESDGTYTFLIKNVSTDTSQTDAFINSISNA